MQGRCPNHGTLLTRTTLGGRRRLLAIELTPTRSELDLRTDANMWAELAIVGCLVGQVGLDGGSRSAVAAAA